MTDNYAAFVNSAVGGRVARSLGLPRPSVLRRFAPGAPLVPGPVLLGGHGSAPVADVVRRMLRDEGVEVIEQLGSDGSMGSAGSGGAAGSGGSGPTEGAPAARARLGAVVVDLTQVATPADLESARALLAPGVRALGPGGRVVMVGRPVGAVATSAGAPGASGATGSASDPALGAARQALEGITRSVGKELRGGATANLVVVAEGAEPACESTLRFLLSGRSAYVSGQVLTVGAAGVTTADAPMSWERPLAGKVAVVTGAARGIGAAIASVLARDGASVVVVDLDSGQEALAGVADDTGGSALTLDVTADDAGRRIAERCAGLDGAGGIDVLVHNAGITRDRLLVNTDADRWRSVLDVNLGSVLRMNATLLGEGAVRDGGRLVMVSSTSGIAGNRGQANYAASKAGIIGLVRTMAQDPTLIARGITANAVAPGFIETEMTAKMPLLPREVARRINSLAQGGLPVDVAEAVAFFAQGASAAVTGNVLRVCGQSQLGA